MISQQNFFYVRNMCKLTSCVHNTGQVERLRTGNINWNNGFLCLVSVCFDINLYCSRIEKEPTMLWLFSSYIDTWRIIEVRPIDVEIRGSSTFSMCSSLHTYLLYT